MRSKITIHTASNYKPCIKVVEAGTAHWSENEDYVEDVRDKLVQGFRNQLNHISSTAQIVFEGNANEYLILPVDDEIKYFKGLLMNKYIGDSESRESLLELSKLINTHLNTVITTS